MTEAVVLVWATHCDRCLTSPPASTFPHSPPTPHSSQRTRPCHSPLKNFQGLLTTRRTKAEPSPQPRKLCRIRLACTPGLFSRHSHARLLLCVGVCAHVSESAKLIAPSQASALAGPCLDSSYLCEGSDLPTSSPARVVTCLFLPAYPSGCAAVSHHSLCLHFPDFL